MRTVVIGLALVAGGCEQAKSANPLSPSIAGPIPGVNISAPSLLEPGQNAEIVQRGELVTLLIENPSTNGERPLWMSIQMASDPTFERVVHQADRVSPGPNGRTAYRIPELLATGFTYYWRVKAQDGANEGPFSAARAFRVLEPVVIDAPTPLEPIGNLTTITPVFKLRNGRISGTSGVIYRIEVATAPDPGAIVAVLSAPADPSGTTSIPVGGQVPYATTYFWRAYGTDGTTLSPYSGMVSFRTPAAPTGPVNPGPINPGPVVPTPGGQRTPNPSPGQRLPLPGYGAAVVDEVARMYPTALRNSCQEHGGTWEFMDRLVDRLRQQDTRWGYNGKRGNAGDPSLDVIAYNYGSQPDPGTTDVYIIDVIVGHCGSNPGGAWIDQTEATRSAGSIGRWISRGRF
jgi:hypothetical protein